MYKKWLSYLCLIHRYPERSRKTRKHQAKDEKNCQFSGLGRELPRNFFFSLLFNLARKLRLRPCSQVLTLRLDRIDFLKSRKLLPRAATSWEIHWIKLRRKKNSFVSVSENQPILKIKLENPAEKKTDFGGVSSHLMRRRNALLSTGFIFI